MRLQELDRANEGIFSGLRRSLGFSQPAAEPTQPKEPPPVYLDDDEINSVINDIVFWIHKNIDISEKRKLLKAVSQTRSKPWDLMIFNDWLTRWATDFESRERYRRFSKEAILKAYSRRIREAVYKNWFDTK